MARRKIICWGLVVLLGIAVALYARHRWQEYHNPTIEYDEQVKLHDGSMIWVHIKRHYVLVGEIGQKSGYLPGRVEISWDTGFEGIGRRSFLFHNVITILDKYDGKWFLGGIARSTPHTLDGAQNCLNVGSKIGYGGCIVVIDEQGQYPKLSVEEMNQFYQHVVANMLSPYSLNHISYPPYFLNKERLNWETKMSYQEKSEKSDQLIGKRLYKDGVFNYE